MKVTLDTNVVVSGFFWNVDSRSILLLVGMNALQNVISKQIFSEYEDVCFRRDVVDKTSKSEEEIKTFLSELKQISEFVEPKSNFEVIKDDPKDNKFLDAAYEGSADYIITYDTHLLDLGMFKGIQILAPLDFLKSMNL